MIERDGPDDTFGWGIVFSDQTFDYLRESDAPSYEAITAACEKWDNVDIVHRGERITVRGNHFSGIARIRFLNILQERCRELGVELRFHQPVDGSRDASGARSPRRRRRREQPVRRAHEAAVSAGGRIRQEQVHLARHAESCFTD